MTTFAALIAAAALLAPSPARAEGKDGKQWKSNSGHEACMADKARLCPDTPNSGSCLHEHWDQLSETCRSYKQEMKKKWEEKQGMKGEGKHEKHGKSPEQWQKHEGKPTPKDKSKMKFEWSKKEPSSPG